MTCPYCGFDNSYFGADNTVVCINCGTIYDFTDIQQFSEKEINS